MGNVNMEASQVNYRGGSKKMSVEEAIKAAGTEITPEEKEWIDTIPELASQEIIAPEFDAEEGVYAVGDLVIYQGGLYQFTTAHETAGAWNAEEVAAVKVSDELDSLKSGLSNLHYRKVAESASTGTLGDKLLSLATAFNALPLAQRRTAFLMRNGVDIFHPINVSGNFFICYIGNDTYIWRYSLNGEAVQSMGGTISDISESSNADVYEIWSCGS